MIESLPTFDLFYRCTACGSPRGPEVKPLLFHCHGASRDKRLPDDACKYGGEQHLHVKCHVCGLEWAMNCANEVEPLTAHEITRIRAAFAEVFAATEAEQ